MEQGLSKQKGEDYLKDSYMELSEAISTGLLIKDCLEDDIIDIIKRSLLTAYFNTGFKAPLQDDFNLMVKNLLTIIQRDFKRLKDKEIPVAISRGILKQYGEYMGISVVSVSHFIKMYSVHNERLNVLKEIYERDNPKPKPTDAEIRRDYIFRLNQLYDNFKAKRLIAVNEACFYFDQLWKEKYIRFEINIKAELKSEALKTVLSLINFKDPDPAKRHESKVLYDDIAKNGEEDERVKAYAKYLGLLKWFEFIQDSGMTLNETLEK